MAVPTVFSPVLPQDFTLTPIRVNKQYVIQKSELYNGSTPITSSGYKIWEGIYIGENLRLQTRTYPTNSWDGSYKHIIWKFLDNRYYRYGSDTFATFEHSNKRFTYKNLGISASAFVIPQGDFGEGILPGSVEITSSRINLSDDKNGNLYDVRLDTGSIPASHNLVASWTFKDLYRDYPLQKNNVGEIKYESKVFSPDRYSRGYNFYLSPSILVMPATSSTVIGEGTTIGLNYNTQDSSYIITDDRPDFNFDSAEDFSISFWAYSHASIVQTGSLISKRGTIQVIQATNTVNSQSYIDQETNVYPYDLSISQAGNLHFRRSDGISTVNVSCSFSGLNANVHIAAIKSGSYCYLYKDGVLQQSATDKTLNPINKHCIMFGDYSQTAKGSGANNFFNDIRIYNKGLTQEQITTLASNEQLTLQTAVVGNVFYKTGTIVIGSDIPAYREVFIDDFTVKFKNTHTIYQYEILSRIKKGAFNLTLNPTATKGHNSDLIIDDFTGSLYPYATTIGFYNDTGELMAIGKLSQPIQMRDDVDINIITRIDV